MTAQREDMEPGLFNLPILTAERVREVLDYNPNTGVFTWRVNLNPRLEQIGCVAGAIRKDGYIHIGIGGTRYLAHRLAWLYVHGEWPDDQIDHRDLLRSNNRIDNLRTANNSQNSANTSRRRTKTDSPKGAYWDKSRQRWLSTIQRDGRQIYLGRFQSAQAAHDAYLKAATELFGEFARGS